MDTPLPAWDALPEDVFRAILAFLPDYSARAAVRHVSRRWNQLADESEQVWGWVAVRRRRCCAAGSASATGSAAAASQQLPAPAQAQPPAEHLISLLHRQRCCLRKLTIEADAVPAIPEERASTVALALEAACGEGSGITDVSLSLTGGVPSFILEALPGCSSQLTSLTLKVLPREGGKGLRWCHLSHLCQLSSLSITAHLSQAGSPRPLRALTCLTCLRLHGAAPRQRGILHFDDVGAALKSCWTGLRRLELVSVEVQHEWGMIPWQDGLPGNWPDGGGGGDNEGGGGNEGRGGNETGDGGEAAGASMRLPPTLWGRWPLLEVLHLHDCRIRKDLLESLPRLPCLTSLHLAPKRCNQQAAEMVLRCTNLQELVLGRYLHYQLPHKPPEALTQLTRLRISGSEELMKMHSSWCALPNLLSFELESCEQLLHLPIELSCLTQLQRLSFSHQRMAELPWQLTGMSQLTRLAVSACSLEDLPPGPYLLSLRELVLFANNLRHVPAVLVDPEWGASGLYRLDLSSNYSHHLSDADVEVLRQLSRLTHLDLRRQQYREADAHPRHLVQQLREALQHCDIYHTPA